MLFDRVRQKVYNLGFSNNEVLRVTYKSRSICFFMFSDHEWFKVCILVYSESHVSWNI